MKKIKNVIIFSNNHDWHSKQLKKELQKLSCKVFYRSLEDCYINTSTFDEAPDDTDLFYYDGF